MTKNEKISQKYPFFRKWLFYFEAEWVTCGCICKVCKREWKDYWDFVDIEYQKLISHSVTRWLSLYPSLPRMLHMYPASHSCFMYIHKPTVVLKRFLAIIWTNSVWNICSHFWLLLWTTLRILRSPKHHLFRTENRGTCCDILRSTWRCK